MPVEIFDKSTLKKVLVSGGTTVLFVYVGQNFLGLSNLPPEDTLRAAVTLGAVSGLGCVLGDAVVGRFIGFGGY